MKSNSSASDLTQTESDFVVRLKLQRVACSQIVRPQAITEHVAEFDTMFCQGFGEGIESGKHVARTADQSAQTGEKID